MIFVLLAELTCSGLCCLAPVRKSCTVAIIKPDVVAQGKADEIMMKVGTQLKP